MISSVGTRDIEKMLGYFAKGSDPVTLARTVKTMDKAQARYVVARALDWKDAAYYFLERCKELGASADEIEALKDFAMSYQLPEQYRTKFKAGPSEGNAKTMRDWFPKLLKVLNNHGITTFNVTKRNPDRDELEMDQRNGKCWTLAYTLEFDKDGDHYKWRIANHSNEGGGSFGVTCKDLGVYYGKQQELADRAEESLSRNDESIKHAVNQILNGVSVREALGFTDVIEPVTESFSVGAYLKFKNGTDGYFEKDNKNDVHLVFEMPMDGLIGKLNPAVTFKLIGYSGDQAKIVAMVNDNMNGNRSGEVYFVNRSELDNNAKAVQPRNNRETASKYIK